MRHFLLFFSKNQIVVFPVHAMYQSWKNNHINQTVIILFPLIKNKFSNFVFIFYWHQQFIKCYMHVFFSSRWVNIQITTFEFIYQKVIYCISKTFDRYPWLFFQYLLIMIVNNFEIRTIVINISPNILNFVKISINTLPLTRIWKFLNKRLVLLPRHLKISRS